MECGNVLGTFLQTPAPVLCKYLTQWVQDFILFWAGIWHFQRESAILPALALDTTQFPNIIRERTQTLQCAKVLCCSLFSRGAAHPSSLLNPRS